MEDAPQRVLYKSMYSTTSEQEDGREQIVFITLSSIFVIVLICCLYEVYRTDKQYRKRKEMETDASILWSKEQAAKLQEPIQSIAFIQTNEVSKPTQNGKVKSNGTTTSTTVDNNLITNDKTSSVDLKPRKCLEKRISFRGSSYLLFARGSRIRIN